MRVIKAGPVSKDGRQTLIIWMNPDATPKEIGAEMEQWCKANRPKEFPAPTNFPAPVLAEPCDTNGNDKITGQTNKVGEVRESIVITDIARATDSRGGETFYDNNKTSNSGADRGNQHTGS